MTEAQMNIGVVVEKQPFAFSHDTLHGYSDRAICQNQVIILKLRCPLALQMQPQNMLSMM